MGRPDYPTYGAMRDPASVERFGQPDRLQLDSSAAGNTILRSLHGDGQRAAHVVLEPNEAVEFALAILAQHDAEPASVEWRIHEVDDDAETWYKPQPDETTARQEYTRIVADWPSHRFELHSRKVGAWEVVS